MITYYVQRYRPKFEAISKEVQLLANHFSSRDSNKNEEKVKIHDLHLDGLFRFKYSSKYCSFHFFYYPLLFGYTKALSKISKINHIYTSLGDLPYLRVLDLNNTILTGAASCNTGKIKKRLPSLKKLDKIIVESELQRKQLMTLGVSKNKIELIYPPVDLRKFNYIPAKGKFKILFASCPTRVKDFERRGIYLLLETAKLLPEVDFILAWRKQAYPEIKRLLKKMKVNNIILQNNIISDFNREYALVHSTIIPYTKRDNYLKLIPNSALESLAAGKPVLISSKVELANIIQREKCGIIFEPSPDCLVKAIRELKKNYSFQQKKCRKVAQKYFSQEIFLKKYEKIYSELNRRESKK